MKYQLTQRQKEELERIGDLYRETIYDTSLINLPSIVKAFGCGLKKMNGEISASIAGEVFRFYNLISSNYTVQMRNKINGLHRILAKQLPKDVSFYIICRQKSWESVLRKLLKYYFSKTSIMLSDLIALRIIMDSDMPEKQQEDICHLISNICINFFTKHGMCTLIPPSKQVANNPLFKDYITNPKSNGYKSIHLAFMDTKNNIFEVQIRTQQMDENAEYGPEEDLKKDSKTENSLNHSGYKYDEYETIIEFIYFEPEKVSKPFYRAFYRFDETTQQNRLIIVDKIGLMRAKPIEERAHTF